MRTKILKLIEKNCCEIEESEKNGVIAHHVEVDDLTDDLVKLFSISDVSKRSEQYFDFMEEYNALQGEGEQDILKEEVQVLLEKYCC